MKLYDNAFSPFARKVRMALEHKGLEAEVVDGLAKKNRDELEKVNGRVEVPALLDDGLVVVNSSDIVGYLEHRYPERPALWPADPRMRVRARAWERCSDTVIDAIMVDISYWLWARRPDAMPEGMIEAARADMLRVYDALERDLVGEDFVCGALSVADLALFPQLAAGRTLGVPFDKERHPRVAAWMKRMSTSPLGSADLARTQGYLASADRAELEVDKIFWRGDRIEWVLARGFHRWFLGEIEEGRVLWPGLGLPVAISG